MKRLVASLSVLAVAGSLIGVGTASATAASAPDMPGLCVSITLDDTSQTQCLPPSDELSPQQITDLLEQLQAQAPNADRLADAAAKFKTAATKGQAQLNKAIATLQKKAPNSKQLKRSAARFKAATAKGQAQLQAAIAAVQQAGAGAEGADPAAQLATAAAKFQAATAKGQAQLTKAIGQLQGLQQKAPDTAQLEKAAARFQAAAARGQAQLEAAIAQLTQATAQGQDALNRAVTALRATSGESGDPSLPGQLCFIYDFSVNGQGQAGELCLPPSDVG